MLIVELNTPLPLRLSEEEKVKAQCVKCLKKKSSVILTTQNEQPVDSDTPLTMHAS
jgi:hypothetical protein